MAKAALPSCSASAPLGRLEDHDSHRRIAAEDALGTAGAVCPMTGRTFYAYVQHCSAPCSSQLMSSCPTILLPIKAKGVQAAIAAIGAQLFYLPAPLSLPEPERATVHRAQGTAAQSHGPHQAPSSGPRSETPFQQGQPPDAPATSGDWRESPRPVFGCRMGRVAGCLEQDDICSIHGRPGQDRRIRDRWMPVRR
jgi:hypothetical protein